MKRLLTLLTLGLLLSACSTTSNDYTHALLPQPKSTSVYQCDSGHRIFVWSETKKEAETVTLQYRRDKYVATRQTGSIEHTYQGDGIAWTINQLTAELFQITNNQKTKQLIERCHIVLK